ncbi:hypothetical protein H2203_007529 [Taxawa tesnikishii (nom. ined.)]|nr:hypothetical protein H2203_007529 [Dothideales sp. JES 119]
MASIFTYEEEVPRVSSPWTKTGDSTPVSGLEVEERLAPSNGQLIPILLSDTEMIRLEPEPQEGPVEYKLHLLLRSRRRFDWTSTNDRARGPKHLFGSQSRSSSESAMNANTSPGALVHQTRQHRLQQLTTQLLWRLQQSSPHHTSSATNLVLPHLPEAHPELQTPPEPARLAHGLEESQGALYEIGVSDDGTFVGLADDEMAESLNNLRAMAASLGCTVEVTRMVIVGKCKWTEDVSVGTRRKPAMHSGNLFVAEALVKPHLGIVKGLASTHLAPEDINSRAIMSDAQRSTTESPASSSQCPTVQLRISLTGATMSGKSSLLGTLSTSTMDNGRGKSRLSMLKHRHEITSGITSSVTQELIGYRTNPNGEHEVVNYATNSIASWIEIHGASADERLVLISDSAGHPRYRRTTVRGLVGWQPHWTVLCIPADDAEDSYGKFGSTPTSREVLGPAAVDVDLSATHLDLCIRLGLPLVVVVTKLDLASKTGLRLTLSKLLSTLKAAGRSPLMVPNGVNPAGEEVTNEITTRTYNNMRKLLEPLSTHPTAIVPILMTSAVDGRGFENLHALLNQLPIPSPPASSSPDKDQQTAAIFHVEDVYNKPTSTYEIIVSGRMQHGRLSIGDVVTLGPCSGSTDDSDDSDGQRLRRPSSLQTSRSFPGALKARGTLAARIAERQEWRTVKVASIRNLRLPVNTLYTDQVGTLGLSFADPDDAAVKIRKGMVIARIRPAATSTLVAEFKREDLGSLAVGSQVVLYIASVRASARIISASTPESRRASFSNGHSGSTTVEKGFEPTAGAVTHEHLLVTFHFDASKEYIEVDSKILVVPGGGPGLYGGTERGEKGIAGLEGFVGRITEVFE